MAEPPGESDDEFDESSRARSATPQCPSIDGAGASEDCAISESRDDVGSNSGSEGELEEDEDGPPVLAMLEDELGRLATPPLRLAFAGSGGQTVRDPFVPTRPRSGLANSFGPSTSQTLLATPEPHYATPKTSPKFLAGSAEPSMAPPEPSLVRKLPRTAKRQQAIARTKQKRQNKVYMRHLRSLLSFEPEALAFVEEEDMLDTLLDAVVMTSTSGDPDDLMMLTCAEVLDLLYSLAMGTPEEERSEVASEFLLASERGPAARVAATAASSSSLAASASSSTQARRENDKGKSVVRPRRAGGRSEEPVLQQIYRGNGKKRNPNRSSPRPSESTDESSSLSDDEYQRLGDSTDLSDLSPKLGDSAGAADDRESSDMWLETNEGPSSSSPQGLRRPIIQRKIQRDGDGGILTQGRRTVQSTPPLAKEGSLAGSSEQNAGSSAAVDDGLDTSIFVSPGARRIGQSSRNNVFPSNFADEDDYSRGGTVFSFERLDDLSTTGRRRPRPRYRNPRHSSPYHLVPEESEQQVQGDSPSSPPNPDGRTCRICLGDENWTTMLSPCACDGSAKWVHRVCLARWRKTATNVISKVQCEVCHTYYRIARMPSSRKFVLDAYVTLKSATVICEIFLVLYYMLLTYVVGFATRVAANLLPAHLLVLPDLPDTLPTPTATRTGGSLTEIFDEEVLESSFMVVLLAVKFVFALLQLVNRLRMSWHHLPLSFFMLGAYNLFSDRTIFFAGLLMCLASFGTGWLLPMRIIGDVLWLASVVWAFPLLWQDTKRRARLIAPRLLLLLVEVGDRGDEEVLNHDD